MLRTLMKLIIFRYNTVIVCNGLTTELPKNMIQIPGIVAANSSDLILSDGSRVESDVFLICTGYLYDYPFLDESSGISVTKGKYIHPLYKHLINFNNPTMAFIGLPHPSLPFLVPYAQAQYFVSLLQNKIELPIYKEMLRDSQLPPGVRVSKAHVMEIEVFDYYNSLAKAADVKPLPFSMKKAAAIYVKDKGDHVLHFNNHEIIIRDDGRVELIRPQGQN